MIGRSLLKMAGLYRPAAGKKGIRAHISRHRGKYTMLGGGLGIYAFGDRITDRVQRKAVAYYGRQRTDRMFGSGIDNARRAVGLGAAALGGGMLGLLARKHVKVGKGIRKSVFRGTGKAVMAGMRHMRHATPYLAAAAAGAAWNFRNPVSRVAEGRITALGRDMAPFAGTSKFGSYFSGRR